MVNARDKEIAQDPLIAQQSYGQRSQIISITDLISEGPIEGLVTGGAYSVFLNNDPMKDVTYSSVGSVPFEATQEGNLQASVAIDGTLTLTIPEQYQTPEYHERVLSIREVGKEGVNPVPAVFENEQVIELETTNVNRTFPDWVDDLYDLTGLRVESARLTLYFPGSLVETVVGSIVKKVNSRTVYFQPLNISDSLIQKVSNARATTVSYDFLTFIQEENNQIKEGFPNPSTSNLTSGFYRIDLSDVSLRDDLTGEDVDSEDFRLVYNGQHQVSLYSQYKYEQSTVQFRNGEASQPPIDYYGQGIGAVEIPAGSSFSARPLEYWDSFSEEAPEGVSGSQEVVIDSLNNSGFGLDTVSKAKEVDEIRLIFTYQSLLTTNTETGTQEESSAIYDIDIEFKRGNLLSRVPVQATRIHRAKSSTAIAFEEVINLELFKPFDSFKVFINRRTRHNGKGVDGYGLDRGADPDKFKVAASASITTVSSLIKENLTYPYTSYANVTFSSKDFTSLPSRSYFVRGLKVQIPSNYTTRLESGENSNLDTTSNPWHPNNLYSGFWDGSFREELVYTDNPAWIFYDLLRNNRYGLGTWIREVDIDKYSLYRIARYCDELVSDGRGGFEPRFRANIYLQKAADAYKVLKDFATTFLGLLYWMDSKVVAISDVPKEPVYSFSKSNVIDGTFNYESTGGKTRINQVVVEWNNPEGNYEREVLLVEDRENIIKTGRIITQNATAFGCTSEAQAYRYGRWKLWTAINQTEVVSFSTSLDSAFLSPGDVILIQDANEFNIPYSGRLSNTGTLTTSTLTLDRVVNLNSGSTYYLSVILEKEQVNESDEAQKETKVEERQVSSTGAVSVISVTQPFSDTPTKNSVWVLREETSLGVAEASGKKYRIISISESSKAQYDISAVEYYDEKYDAVDFGFNLNVPDTVYKSYNPVEIGKPVKAFYAVKAPDPTKTGDEFTLFWERTEDEKDISGYQIYHDVPNYPGIIEVDGTTNSFSFEKVPDGVYNFSIRVLNDVNNRSEAKTLQIKVEDIFGKKIARLGDGLPVGGTVGFGIRKRDSLIEFRESPTVVIAAGNPSNIFTGAVKELNFSSLSDGKYYVLFTRNVLNGVSEPAQLLPFNYIQDNSLNVSYWKTPFLVNTFQSIANVSGTAGSPMLRGSGFLNSVDVGTVLKLGSTFAAKVLSVLDDERIVIDKPVSSTETFTAEVLTYTVDLLNDTIAGELIIQESTSSLTSYMAIDSSLAPESALNVTVTSSSNGSVFKNNEGAEKILSATVFDGGNGQNVTNQVTSFKWYREDSDVYVDSSNRVVPTGTAGAILAEGNFPSIIVGPEDIEDGGSEAFEVEVELQ